MMSDVSERRQAFINDIVEVCKRHRVLLEVDDELCGEFVEQVDKKGYGFNVNVGELERAVVDVVWYIIHGKRGER